MHELHSDIIHICKSNKDIIELEIFKFIKIADNLFFLTHVFNVNRILYKSIKIDPIPDVEESIFYQLHLRLKNKEIWISNLGAQTQQPEQELTPLIILAPPFIQVPPHGPGSGA